MTDTFSKKPKKSYSPELYEQIRDALDLPKDSQETYWVIEDKVPHKDIYLIHYVRDKLKEIINTETYTSRFTNQESGAILSLRGIIISLIDPENPWICCKSDGFTPQITVNTVGTGLFKGTDQYGNEVKINVNQPEVIISQPVIIDGKAGFIPIHELPNVSFQPFYQGPVIRVWKYLDVTYASSHHKIFTYNSKWGDKESFESFFIRYFGKGCETLEDIGAIIFDKSKPTSNFCHIFILTLPKISVGSRMDIGVGFITYLRNVVLNVFYDIDAFHHYKHWDSIDIDNKWSYTEQFFIPPCTGKNNVPVPPCPKDGDEKFILSVPTFDYKIANKILQTGYTEMSMKECESIDERLRTGNSVIMLLPKENRIIKITKPTVKVDYELQEIGSPNLADVVFDFVVKHNLKKGGCGCGCH